LTNVIIEYIGVQKLLACTDDTCATVISNAMHALSSIAEHPESKRIHDGILVAQSTIDKLRALIVAYSASSAAATAEAVMDKKHAVAAAAAAAAVTPTTETKTDSTTHTSATTHATSTSTLAPVTHACALSATSHELWRASPLVVRAVQCALDVILWQPY
jgi:activator of HSP90 ATPase